MPGEFLLIDLRSACCALGIILHAVYGYIAFLLGEEFGVRWGVGEEEGYEDAEENCQDSLDDKYEWPDV